MKNKNFIRNLYDKLKNKQYGNAYTRQVFLSELSSAEDITPFKEVAEINQRTQDFIETAEEEVLFQFYKYEPFSEGGDKIQQAIINLQEKAQATNKTIKIKFLLNERSGPAAYFTRKYPESFSWLKRDDAGLYAVTPEGEKKYLPNLEIKTRLHKHFAFNSYHGKQIIVDKKTIMMRSGDVYDDDRTEMASIIKSENIAKRAAKSYLARWKTPHSQISTFREKKLPYYEQHDSTIPILLLEKNPSTNPLKSLFNRSPYKVAVIEAIKTAETSVKILTPNLNDKDIIAAIIKALKSGIKVELVTGIRHNQNEESKISMGGTNQEKIKFIYDSIPVELWDKFQVNWACDVDGKLIEDKSVRTMHSKLVIVDECIVIAGSSAMDKQSTYNSSENDFVVESTEIAKKYLETIFTPVFERSNPESEYQKKLGLIKSALIKEIERISFDDLLKFRVRDDVENITIYKKQSIAELISNISNANNFHEIHGVLSKATEVSVTNPLAIRRNNLSKKTFGETKTIQKLATIFSKFKQGLIVDGVTPNQEENVEIIPEELRKKEKGEIEPKKPWTIIGAGPVGSMQALIFATLFPDQKIYVLDRYRANIRGHGLEIHKETIDQMVEYLKGIKGQIDSLNNLSASELEHYQTVKINIDTTISFLQKNFSGAFIRTHAISKMLQDQACMMSKNVEFRLDCPVDENNLKKFIKVGDNPIEAEQIIPIPEDVQEVVSENQEIADQISEEISEEASLKQSIVDSILEESSIIFGADGSHSKVRKHIFGESDEDLQKTELAYLIEMKFEMVRPKHFFDRLNKMTLPSLKKGDFYVWNQSKDGTASLHLFVDKKTYDALRTKELDGKQLGKFENPYKRLAQLPSHLRKPIMESISNIIEVESIDHSSLKITTIPMAVYKSRQLVKQVEEKTFALVGDCAVGLVLAQGVNNGLYSTVEYGRGLFSQSLENKKIGDGIENYQNFRERQIHKFRSFEKELVTKHPNLEQHKEQIYNQYSKIFLEIMSNPSHSAQEHRMNVEQATRKFDKFIVELQMLDKKQQEQLKKFLKPITDTLFIDLAKNKNVFSNPISPLHLSEARIFETADKKIVAIKKKISLIKGLHNTIGRLFSSYLNSKPKDSAIQDEEKEDHKVELKAQLKALKAIFGKREVTQDKDLARLIFDFDVLCLKIKEKINTLPSNSKKEQHELAQLLIQTISYLKSIYSNDSEVVAKVSSTAMYKKYLDSQLHSSELRESSQQLRVSVQKTNTYKKETTPDLSTAMAKRVVTGIDNHIQARERSAFSNTMYRSDIAAAKLYQSMLKNEDTNPLMQLSIVYAILTDKNAKNLQSSILKEISKDNHAKVSVSDLRNEAMKLIQLVVAPEKQEELSQILDEITQKINKRINPSLEVQKLSNLFTQDESSLQSNPNGVN